MKSTEDGGYDRVSVRKQTIFFSALLYILAILLQKLAGPRKFRCLNKAAI